MSSSRLPPCLATAFSDMASWLHKNSAARLPLPLSGVLLASGRRTATSWSRPVGISADFRRAYSTVHATGRRAEDVARSVFTHVASLLQPKRLRVSVDDTPTPRFGPHVEGAGIRHNPTPGPANESFVYGHVWVVLVALARHHEWGTLSLPLQAQFYVREKDLPKSPPGRPRESRTELELAIERFAWLEEQAKNGFGELWVVTDGGYAKMPFLKGAKDLDFTVVSRLRKDAALLCLPEPKKAGQRGPQATYGKRRISLAKRAGQERGWQEVECVQYGRVVTKTIKTFLATYRPVARSAWCWSRRRTDGCRSSARTPRRVRWRFWKRWRIEGLTSE